jgi:predicted ATPase
MGMLAMIHQVRGEIEATCQLAEQTIKFSDDHGHPYWVALASIVKGWALAQDGNAGAGIDMICNSLDAYKAKNARLGNSSFLVFLAEAHQQAGHYEDGLRAVCEAIDHIEETGERYYEAETHRRKGELLLANFGSKGARDAEAHFEHALVVANEQHALSWALRAATSLARLRVEQGRWREALVLLRAYRERLCEGNGTADLRDVDIMISKHASSPNELPHTFH